MPDTKWFEITDGTFALALVDTEAEGYNDTWMAPSGLSLDVVTLASYEMPVGSSWYCQLTNGQIQARSSTTTRNRAATFCNPASTATTPVASSYTLQVEWAQDIHVSTGLSRFLFENDAQEAYFFLGLSGGSPPKAMGRVYLADGAFGGKPGEDLVSTSPMLLSRRPVKSFGDGDTSVIVS